MTGIMMVVWYRGPKTGMISQVQTDWGGIIILPGPWCSDVTWITGDSDERGERRLSPHGA